MNRFVFNDSGTGTPATSEQLSEQLIDLMHAKPADEEALKIKIGAFGKMDAYVKSILPTGTTPEAEFSLNGYRSRGIIDGRETAFSKAHQLLGIVRRGAETGEWFDVRGKTDPEIKTYIVETFGITDGSEQLDQALIRFKAVTNGAATLPFDVPRIIEAARDGSNTEYGERFTNSMRIFRGYIVNGGELEQTLKQEVHQQIDNFMGSLQTQAHPELSSLKGDALAERNRVLGIEEQRAAVYNDYEALTKGGKIEKFFRVVKAALPRICKSLIFPAIAFLPILVPALAVVAPGMATGMTIIGAGLRIVSLVGIGFKGLPQVYNAVKQGNWKAGVTAAAGFGVNALAVSFLPPSLGLMLGIGAVEAIGVATANEFALSKEAKDVVKSFTKYESAANQFIDDIDATTDVGIDQLEKLTRSLNIDITLSSPGVIDSNATKLAIKAARKTARDTNNMSLLREYGKLMEHHVEASAQTLRDENLETKRVRDEIQQIIVSYGVGSGLGKIGTRVVKDGITGATSEEGFWNSAKGAVLGGLGLSGLELGNNDETGTTNENGSKLAAIDKSLEENYDSIAAENEFINKGDNNILGLTESADGTETYALVDADGDGVLDYLVGVEADPSNPGQFALSNNVQGMINDDGTAALSDNPTILKTQVMAFSGNDDVTISPAPAGADDSVQAIVEIGDKDYVLVENGDGVNELYEAKLEYVTNTTTSTAGAESSTSYESISVTAGEGTRGNQWSMVEDLYRQAAPGLDDQTYYTLTANSINEVGGPNLYSYMDRTHGGYVQDGDTLTLASLEDAAPNEFAKFLNIAERKGIEITTGAPADNVVTTTEKVLTVKSISDTSEFAFEQGEQSLQSGVIFASTPGESHLIFNQGQVVATVANGSTTPTDATGDDSTIVQDDDDTTEVVKAPVAKEASPVKESAPEQPETVVSNQESILDQLGITSAKAGVIATAPISAAANTSETMNQQVDGLYDEIDARVDAGELSETHAAELKHDVDAVLDSIQSEMLDQQESQLYKDIDARVTAGEISQEGADDIKENLGNLFDTMEKTFEETGPQGEVFESKIPDSDDPTDMIEINNRPSADFIKGLFDGGGEEIFESTVDKIYIHGKGLEHGKIELDINEIDVLRIDPEDKIVYRLADGTKQTIDLHDRKVDFVFKGDDDRVPMDGGNLLNKMNTTLDKLDQFATATSETLSQAGDSAESFVTTTNQAVIEARETFAGIYNKFGEWDPNEIRFDPGPGMGEDYPLPQANTLIYDSNNAGTIMDTLVLGDEEVPYNRVISAGLHTISYLDIHGDTQTITDYNNEIYGTGESNAGSATISEYIYKFPIGKNMPTINGSPVIKVEKVETQP